MPYHKRQSYIKIAQEWIKKERKAEGEMEKEKLKAMAKIFKGRR